MSGLGLELGQRYEQRLRPGLVALANVLPLPAMGLELAVEREAADNPALERQRDDARECATSCGWCQGRRSARPQDSADATPAAPVDGLLADARLLLAAREARLAEYVVASLDGRGLLGRPLSDLGRETGASPQELESVVRALRAAGPPWIAAQDLRDALLLQLDALGPEAPPLARRLVDEHMDALASGAFAAAARSLGVSRAEVVEARDFIRTRLEPPTSPVGAGAAAAARPDVVVRTAPGGELEVDLPDVRHVRVRVDPVWRRCAQDPGRTAAERELARELVGRARAFAHSLEDRQRTLAAIAELVVHRQDAFARGDGAPLPLTRAAVARGAGVHESTVSRAVAGKLVQLANGRVVEFSSFFRSSLGAEEALARVVAAERRPLSDAQLAAELSRLGYPLARRTVTKYRTRLGIVPHAVR